MFEKLARAMMLELKKGAYVDDTYGLKELIIDGTVNFEDVTRAALTALLEPDEAMIQAGCSEEAHFLRSCRQTYQAMIRSAFASQEA